MERVERTGFNDQSRLKNFLSILPSDSRTTKSYGGFLPIVNLLLQATFSVLTSDLLDLSSRGGILGGQATW